MERDLLRLQLSFVLVKESAVSNPVSLLGKSTSVLKKKIIVFFSL